MKKELNKAQLKSKFIHNQFIFYYFYSSIYCISFFLEKSY